MCHQRRPALCPPSGALVWHLVRQLVRPLASAASALLLLATGQAAAQAPTGPELVAAMATSTTQARQSGLVWRTQQLWLEALRHRSPMVAVHHRGVCHLGYSAYTPGQDFRWLFPDLPPAQRSAWLAGVVHHELAHCAEQAAAGGDAQAVPVSPRQQEVLADLAFALQVDQADNGADGPALVALLAALRARQASADPVHDTSAALQCYLQQRGRFAPPGDWLTQLQAWRSRCGTGTDNLPGAPPAGMAAAWAAPAAAQSSAPQPVGTRR